ncbi:hypothetical protein OH77DRAFT_1225096 [Trametes cingulata]|nr:hypothetical protein OH77DRAFT_1225096 [Trametes cingulata]
MGRPLYSSTRQPAVRVQPEVQHPTYEKWTYANAFDPDSDEFFDNEDAVYEAFIDPGQQIQLPASPATGVTMLESSASSSSSASAGTSSGRGSPMEVVDLARFEAEARAAGMRVLDDTRLPVPTPRNPVLDAQLEAGRRLPAQERYQYYVSLIEGNQTRQRQRQREETRPSVRDRIPTYLDLPQEESRSPSPETVVLHDPPTPVRPSTPPSHGSAFLASPSPPPSVTPRLYTWTTFPSATVPPPASPLTNRGARVSVARITTPSLIPAYRAA